VILEPRGGVGTCISLDRVPASVHVPPRIHLDLYTEDQSAEVQRLLGLGATRVEWSKRPADADYVIMADLRATVSASSIPRAAGTPRGPARAHSVTHKRSRTTRSAAGFPSCP
jgi:hypothetical protein